MDDDGELYQYIRIRILRNLFQHQRFLSEARDGEPEVIWIGDSLIQNLFNSRIWDQSFCLMHSVNFGISGDRTENVLWRLENGELEEVAPKVKLKTDNNRKQSFYNYFRSLFCLLGKKTMETVQRIYHWEYKISARSFAASNPRPFLYYW